MNEERLNKLDSKWAHAEHEKWICEIEHEELLELIAAARERNELKAERDALHETHTDKALAWDKLTEKNEQIATLRGNNAALREALTAAKDVPMKWKTKKPFEIFSEISDICDKALARTPADSLREYRNGVLEEVCSQVEKEWPSSKVLVTIRAMRTTNDTD